jgi:hypothetical protein
MTTEEATATTIERCAKIAEGTFTYGLVDGDDGTSDARARLIADRIRALAVVSPTPPTAPTDDELIKLYVSPRAANDYAPFGLLAWADGLRAVFRAGFVADNQEQEKTE